MALKTRLIAVLAMLAAAVVVCASSTVRASASSTLHGPFHVSGTQVLDANNLPVIFKGVTRDGTELYYGNLSPDFPSTAGGELDHMLAWGTNTIRLPLSEDLWNGGMELKNLGQKPPRQMCGGEHYDKYYPDELDTVVRYATQHGMLVILELDFTNPNCMILPSLSDYHGGGANLPLPGVGSLTFWQDIAAARDATHPYGFGDNPMIAFEIYNEPHVCPKPTTPSSPGNAQAEDSASWCGINQTNPPSGDVPYAALWANGADVYTGTQTYPGVGLRTLYNTVRALSNNLILVDGNAYGGDAWQYATSYMWQGSNMVYAAHLYPQPKWTCSTKVGTAPNQGNIKSAIDWFWQWSETPSAHPVMFDEIGWPKPNDPNPNMMNFMMDYLHTKGLGWTAFSWGVYQATYNSWWPLLRSAQNGPLDATNTGLAVKNALKGVYSNTCA